MAVVSLCTNAPMKLLELSASFKILNSKAGRCTFVKTVFNLVVVIVMEEGEDVAVVATTDTIIITTIITEEVGVTWKEKVKDANCL